MRVWLANVVTCLVSRVLGVSAGPGRQVCVCLSVHAPPAFVLGIHGVFGVAF